MTTPPNSMAVRTYCLHHGVFTGRQCPACQRARQRERSRNRVLPPGHRATHARERNRWKAQVATGTIHCSRCGRLIAPDAQWDADKRITDDGAVVYLPSHSRCNRAAGAAP